MIELFNKLIEVRDVAHQIHLSKSETQATHEALEDFYTSLLENMDEMIEVYQGQFGLIEDFGKFNEVDTNDHIKYFQDFADFINSKRKDVDQQKSIHLEAMIDDIMISTYKLLYKMKYLK